MGLYSMLVSVFSLPPEAVCTTLEDTDTLSLEGALADKRYVYMLWPLALAICAMMALHLIHLDRRKTWESRPYLSRKPSPVMLLGS